MESTSDDVKHVRLLESYFEHIYARALLEVFQPCMKENCYGYVVDHPSQVQHYCLMMSQDEQIDFCFEDMLKKVDETGILDKWNEAVSDLKHMSPELIVMYKLKIYCDDWRAADMKTDDWKERMRDTVVRLLKLERLF